MILSFPHLLQEYFNFIFMSIFMFKFKFIFPKANLIVSMQFQAWLSAVSHSCDDSDSNGPFIISTLVARIFHMFMFVFMLFEFKFIFTKANLILSIPSNVQSSAWINLSFYFHIGCRNRSCSSSTSSSLIFTKVAMIFHMQVIRVWKSRNSLQDPRI